jgi:hypothetical protein
MKKTYLAVAAVAALGLSGAAFADEGKKPAPMTDSEMDGVTAAGTPTDPGPGFGILTADQASDGRSMGTPPPNKGKGKFNGPGPALR